MVQAVQARLDAHFGADPAPAADRALSQATVAGEVRLTAYDNLSAIEQDWRAFEPHADGTVFQCFDWLATWQRHVGVRTGVTPAIVVGRDGAGNILFLFPLAIRAAGSARELAWLGSDLCDYNAPLLAANFSDRIDRAHFLALWQNITQCLQDHPHLRFDYIDLEKMPETVAAQPNPMRHLAVTLNPSGAYLCHLTGDWETFYDAKRSSHARKGDRNKRRRLSESGAVQLVNPASEADAVGVLDILMTQKARAFARMGVANLFARPGYAEFYRALVTSPATKHFVHVSTLNVGTVAAAANLGLMYRGCFYHLLASYDDGELSRFGPGAVHLQDLLQLAIARGDRIFDFTIGDERYKRDWCDTELKLYDYVSAATWRGALIAVPMLAMQRLKRWIKQTPMVWQAFSAGRALLASLMGRR